AEQERRRVRRRRRGCRNRAGVPMRRGTSARAHDRRADRRREDEGGARGGAEGEKRGQALEMAREVQMSTLPATMPAIPGYDVCGSFRPAELTGGDTFDLSLLDTGLLIVLADATGHGLPPPLSVTRVQ